MSNHPIRNVFPDEEPTYWKDAINNFPNKVPRFTNKVDAKEFVLKYCQIGSNPEETQMRQSITMFTSWLQIEKYLLPKIHEYNCKFKKNLPTELMLEDNRFFISINDNNNNNKIEINMDNINEIKPWNFAFPSGRKAYNFILSRLNLSIHRRLTETSVQNTLKYLFYHMKCGVFCMIRNNKVVIFSPFVNKDYRNTWGKNDKGQPYPLIDSVNGTAFAYYNEKSKHYREEEYIEDLSQWWANGNIICNIIEKTGDMSKAQYWGDQFLLQMKDMIVETCSNREIPDCSFFLNKRDYPQLKFHKDNSTIDNNGIELVDGRPVEPYGFIFDKDDRNPNEDIPLNRHAYKSYAPILSFYTSDRFTDIPFPPSEDWEAATGEVFPTSFNYTINKDDQIEVANPRDLFTSENLKKFEIGWNDKKPTALFRGTATGGGVTIETNQRLNLAHLSHEWSKIPKLQGKGVTGKVIGLQDDDDYPYLDAKITAWNLRDKKLSNSKMKYLQKKDFNFTGGQENFIEIYKQSSYKYLIYAEGHCAACRYGFMMQMGSVILKVDSMCVADQLWYFPLLRPFYDHVPVKADCSDLEEKIKWCRANDEKCQKIAENAKQLYQYYVSRDGVLDYMQAIFVEISNKWVSPPLFADNPPLTRVPPVSNTGCRTINGNNRECYEGGLCGTCELRKIEEDKINKSIDNRSIGGKSKKSDDPIDEINQLKKEKRLKNIALEKAKNKARKELINSML